MAGISRTALRRRQEEAQARRDRTILLGTIGVLAAAAVIVLVGLYFTVYLPPRASVASIDGQAVTAGDAVDRASFFMVSEGGAFSREIDDLAELGVDRLVRDAVLFKEAPALVGEVSDSDADAKAREVLGNLEGEAYADALQAVLQRAGIERQQYREILKSRLLAERLTERFRGELPEAMDQRHVLRGGTPRLVKAQRGIERARGGEDFTGLGDQYGADRQLQVDLGWTPDDLLLPDAERALSGLGAGDVSAPAMSGLFFDVYKVVELQAARPLSDEQRDALADRRVDDWVTERESQLSVTRDLSKDESAWITAQVSDRVQKAFETQSKAAR